MTCKPCIYSPESAAAYLPTSFSDTRQLSLLSGNPMPAESYESEPQTAGSLACKCGKGMSDCSIHPSTRESWIASMQDSLAKTLASLESRQAYLRAPDQVFTAKSCALLASLSPEKSFWKTSQQSFLTDLEPYSQTWPRWGMTAGGSAFAHPMSERRITETDGSYLPTPTVTTGAQVAWDKTPGQTGGTSLAGWVKYWPTPTTDSASSRSKRYAQGGMPLSLAVVLAAGTSLTRNDLGEMGARTAREIFPTPTSHNYKETGAPSQMKRNTVQLGWEVEPGLGRVVNGVSDRVGQLKGYGNAQVPLQAATAYRLLGGV
jgi:hypothetical protein